MASLAAACRISARLARRKLAHDAASRGFRTSAAALGAQNFTMPALSPTMTEGSIAAWRVKEGEKFSAGDVLLEIETDKATMDVEAQDDGIMMKIMQGDGAKGVKVGTRIAVLAEEGDDISSLEIPPDETAKEPEAKEAAKPDSSSAPPSTEETSSDTPKQAAPSKSGGKPQKQRYPLLPSVAHLIKQNGIEESKISEMTPTGPNGRLLKGDVLAYLGEVKANVPSDISARFDKLSHLDLSNIKVAKAPEPKKAEKKAAAAAPPVVEDLLVTLPISLAAVIEVQKKMQDTLGVFMPLSTFISRAADVANDELPVPATAKPTADELFNQVLGLDRAGPRGSQGYYLPQISALPPTSFVTSQPPSFKKKSDIIDILASKPKPTKSASRMASGISTGVNVFSLVVPKAEEKRAKIFLERVKLVLENEPGRLVL